MNLNKILFGIMIALLLCMPVVLAEDAEPVLIDIDDTVEDVIDEEVEEEAGVTPDSPLYGLERAIERIQLKLTFNKAAKAKLGLAHANERLAEVQVMIAEKKMEHAEKAQKAHDKQLEEVEGIVTELDEGDAEETAEAVVEIEKEINLHRMKVEKVGNVLIKVKGELTEEQQVLLGELVASMEGSSAKLKIEIQNKREESKIRLKLQTGQTDEEVEGVLNRISEEYEIERKGKSGVLTEARENLEKEVKAKVKEELEDEKEEEVAEIEETEAEDETDVKEEESVEDDDAEDEEETNGDGNVTA